MAYLAHPTHYSPAEFRTLLAGLKFARGWKPAFPTLHNTGVPSLKQWLAMGATPQERWGANLNAYYKGLGWHAGPHLVVCPDYVWVLSDLEQDGVSVSCWNHQTLGIEMVGNFETGGDDFASGYGAKVRDGAVFVLAALCEKFGRDIAEPLHFHRECVKDHHACPGSRVSKPEIVQRVHALLEGWGQVRTNGAPAPAPSPRPVRPTQASDQGLTSDRIIVTNSQVKLIACGFSCGAAGADGDLGPATSAAIAAVRKAHGLPAGGHDDAFRTALASAYAEALKARGGSLPAPTAFAQANHE